MTNEALSAERLSEERLRGIAERWISATVEDEEAGAIASELLEARAELIDKREAVDRLTADAKVRDATEYAAGQNIAVGVEIELAELRARAEAAEAQLAKMREALEEIAATEPEPLSTADMVPTLWRKLNNAMKIARTALGADHAPD